MDSDDFWILEINLNKRCDIDCTIRSCYCSVNNNDSNGTSNWTKKNCTCNFNYDHSTQMVTWNSNIWEMKKKEKLISMNSYSTIGKCKKAQNFALWHFNLVLEIPMKSVRSEAKKNHCWKHKNRTNAFESKQKPWPIPHTTQETNERMIFICMACSKRRRHGELHFRLVRLIITTIIMILSFQ